jgi:hypothetical protein
MTKPISTLRILLFILLASCMISGCRKVDLSDRSKITISGNTFGDADLNMTYAVDEGNYGGPNGAGCEALLYRTEIYFTLQPVATLNLNLLQQSDSQPLPEGTYYIVDTQCEKGITAYLTVSSQKKAVYFIEISSGTMKVKDDNGTFDINFDFTISPASGGGKLTGNFTGTMGKATVR